MINVQLKNNLFTGDSEVVPDTLIDLILEHWTNGIAMWREADDFLFCTETLRLILTLLHFATGHHKKPLKLLF
jgi:hypothetical protein